MRLFVALVPPTEVRREALRAAKALPWEGEIRWLPQENVHLTLKFLGETPEEKMRGLKETLASVSERHGVLDLALEGIGAFPSTRRARVPWIGVGRGFEPLRALAADVESVTESLGFAREERSYLPHAALGRSRDGKARLRGPQQSSEVGPLNFRAYRVELVQSRLSEEGAVYSTVASYPLGEAEPGLDNGEQRPDGHQYKEKYENHSN